MPVNSVVAEDQIPALLEQMDPFFGVNADVEEPALLETSAFKNLSLDDGKLFFDLGNNMVNAAVGPRGTIQRALIFSGIERKPMTAGLPGVWYSYDFLNICRSDRFGFQIGGELVYLDKIGLKQETRLIDGAFSLASVQIDDLKIHQLVMAPYSKGDAVSGLLVGFYIETGSTTPVKAKLLIAPQWLLNRTMAHDHKWKSTNQLLRNFVDIVSKRGNYLLNIGPDGKGNVPEPCVERFQEMGVWVKNNADAIFGTTRWTTFHEAGSKQKQSKAASPDEFWFSAKGDKVYAMSLAPGAGTVRILSLKKSTGKALNVRLLGSDKSMKWIQTDEALEIDFTGVETSDNG